MKKWISNALLVAGGLVAASLIALLAAPPRGEPVHLQPVPSPAPIVVHVSGAVADPGVYDLPAGSRVELAIARAGGPLPDAEMAGLNLAARIADGSQLHVPFTPAQRDPPPDSGAAHTQDAANPGTPRSDPPGAVININTATQAELESLSGIGPATAIKILAYREENGPFESIEEIMAVSGIGPATFERIQEHISVGP